MNFLACFCSSRVLPGLGMEAEWIKPESRDGSKNVPSFVPLKILERN